MLVKEIFISWKKAEGARRYIIAEIKRNASEGIVFSYCNEGFEQAKNDGLEGFYGFRNAEKLSPEQIEQLLAQRVISKDRPDRDKKNLLSFWDAEKVQDTFDILALTQGKSPTDGFEFLGVYNPEKGTRFVTDLAGISHLDLPKNSVSKGDVLRFENEPTNAHDKLAIVVYKGDVELGYIKQIHNRAFHLGAGIPTLTVKGVDQNGKIKQIFVSVQF